MTADIIPFPAKPPAPAIDPVVTLDLLDRIDRMRIEREALGLGPRQPPAGFNDPMASIRAVASLADE